MSRKQHRLAIWMNGIPVGFCEKVRGEDSLQYLPEWIADKQGETFIVAIYPSGNQL